MTPGELILFAIIVLLFCWLYWALAILDGKLNALLKERNLS